MSRAYASSEIARAQFFFTRLILVPIYVIFVQQFLLSLTSLKGVKYRMSTDNLSFI